MGHPCKHFDGVHQSGRFHLEKKQKQPNSQSLYLADGEAQDNQHGIRHHILEEELQLGLTTLKHTRTKHRNIILKYIS